jgi:hypothetical protein
LNGNFGIERAADAFISRRTIALFGRQWRYEYLRYRWFFVWWFFDIFNVTQFSNVGHFFDAVLYYVYIMEWSTVEMRDKKG